MNEAENGVHAHNAMLLRCKEGWNNAISSYKEETRENHTKWSEIENAECRILLPMESKHGYKKTLQKRNSLLDLEKKLMVTKKERRRDRE